MKVICRAPDYKWEETFDSVIEAKLFIADQAMYTNDETFVELDADILEFIEANGEINSITDDTDLCCADYDETTDTLIFER